jgi:hypothetical protein
VAIQHILHVSKQPFFICLDFSKLYGEDIFRIQDILLSESTRGKKGLALVCLLLFFKLFLELGVCLLKIAEIILEEPRLLRPLQLQLVELSLKIYVLHQLF